MTQRDKLTELLKTDNCESPMLCDSNCKYAHLDRCYEERTADYLLANGVVVLPCKAGDTVYAFCETLNQILDYTVGDICISDDRLMFRAYFRRGYEIVHVIVFDDDDIGKTVFFTRKEAEQTLKEDEDNG